MDETNQLTQSTGEATGLQNRRFMRRASHIVRRPLIFFAFLILTACGLTAASAESADIKFLIKQMREASTSAESGISAEKQKIAKQLWEIGSPAIPYLLPLLSDENQGVRDLASFILRDIDGLTEEHLDALIASRRRGDGWIPPAIARIGTPKAVDFLVDELVREREAQTQLTWAINMLGPKAVPKLVKIYQGDPGWDEQLERTMCSVFSEMGEKAAGAVPPLLKIANDKKTDSNKRIRAIEALGAIGLPAEPAVATLLELHKKGPPKIRRACADAIQDIGAPEAMPFLLENLRERTGIFDKVLAIRDIAQLRTRGAAAGPALVQYLSRSDWDLRIAAARALGYIEYAPATEKLIGLLDSDDDWRVVFNAAESLARLRAPQAVASLNRVAQNHWYPPVQGAAKRASQSIQDGTSYKSGSECENFAVEFFSYDEVGRDLESLTQDEADSVRLPVVLNPADSVEVPIKGINGAIRKEMLRGTPVEGGHLVAWDQGEFGGFLGFIDSKGTLEVIAEEICNVAPVVYLEDIKAQISIWDKMNGLLEWNRPLVHRNPDDPAVILFTSGSEGTPKGVVLSHRNILSNAAQAAARIDFVRNDIAFNVLPLFHSFGLTAGLVLPLVWGLRTYLYPTPLHYRIIPVLVYGTNATLLFGTDTFLAGYAKNANAYDFRSLRYVLAGAERVKDATRLVWMEKFGLRILEGYGVTETSPALAFNTPMFNKFGTVGRMLPGIETRLEPVPGASPHFPLFSSQLQANDRFPAYV